MYWKLHLVLCGVICFLPLASHSSNLTIKIGVLVDNRGLVAETLYEMNRLVDKTNDDPDTLPGYKLDLVHHTTKPVVNAFTALQHTCDMLENDIVVLIGPRASSDVRALHPICAGLHIPQIAPTASDPSLHQIDNPYLLRMSAPDSIQSRALADLVRMYGWSRMAVLVDNSAYGRNGLIEFQVIASNNNWVVTTSETFKLTDDPRDIEVRPQLGIIKKLGVRVVILNTLEEYSWEVIRQAEALNMMDKGWAWIVTDGTTMAPMVVRTNHTANSTGGNQTHADCKFEIPPERLGLIGTRPSSGAGALYPELFGDQSPPPATYTMRYMDSLIVAVTALDNYIKDTGNFSSPKYGKGLCGIKKVEPWEHGAKLLEYMTKVQTDGVMNYLNFTSDQRVWSTNYDIVNLCHEGWTKIGEWTVSNNHNHLEMTKAALFPGRTNKIPDDIVPSFADIILNITTIVEAPFVMLNEKYPLNSSEEFEGYCIDMLKELQKRIGFNYNIRLVKDKVYGTRNPETNQWNGIIRELIDHEADMSVSAMIITSERNKFVDFSKPFMDLGIDILLAKETSEADIFYFFRPFSRELWICIIGATIFCGITIALCSFLSPHGWRGRYIQRRNAKQSKHSVTQNRLNYHNAGWFAIASVMTMGPEVSPRSFSGRVVAGAWWAVVTIISASYTANLAAFLTVARLNTGIKTMHDLAEQSEIKYGTMDGTAIQEFFREQIIPPFPRMYHFMRTDNSWVPNTTVGTQKVYQSYKIPKGKPGKYAYIYDSTILEYITRQPPCTTRTLGQLFKKSGYGIAFPKNSAYVEKFDNAILELRERGIMETIERRWISGTCPDPEAESGSETAGEQLNMEQMAGIFLVFAIGIAMAIVCVFVEYFVAASADAFRDNLEGVKNGGTCYHLKRRLKASACDLRRQVCVCCGKKKNYDMSESTEAEEGSHPSHIDANFSFGRSTVDFMSNNSAKYPQEMLSVGDNKVINRPHSRDEVTNEAIASKRRKYKDNVTIPVDNLYINNGYCNGSTRNLDAS